MAIGRMVKGAARMGGRMGAYGPKKAANAGVAHPGALMAGAGILGIMAGDPLKPASEAAQEELFGDPKALWNMGSAYVANASANLMLSDKDREEQAKMFQQDRL